MQPEKKKRGFANLSPELHKEVSARGGRKKGAKGFASLSPEERSRVSSEAAKGRWQKVKEERENGQSDSEA